nr:MAG TPA: TFIIB zinc-binding [Caudoviricetes sp.]
MGGFGRKLQRAKEKAEQENIKKVYGKKPKGICPKCKKHSLFYTNKDGKMFCIRCDNVVGVSNK